MPLESGIEVDATSVAAIAEALRAFAKALRAHQLYLPNNPTRQRALEIAQSNFIQVWMQTDVLVLSIRETELLWHDHVVYRDTERGVDGLPFLLYRDGLRELQLQPGFEHEELAELLALLQRARAAQPDEDDLVTLLWVGDFTHLQYRHVEVGAENDLPFLAAAAGVAHVSATGVMLAAPVEDAAGFVPGPPPAVVRVDEFDSTLYFLDANEVQYLNDAVRREYAANGKRDVLSILFDIVETQCTGNAIDEVIGVLETLLTELIAAGEYDDVAYLLREARTSAVRATTLPVYAKDALNALSDRLSEPGVMSQLLQVLGEASRVPARATLDLLFAELRPGALAPLVSWLATAHASSALSAVEEAATSLASKHTAELVALLESEDEAKVRGALRLTARLKSPAAVPGLGKVMHSDNVELRVAAVAALGDIGSASALQILERVIDDAEREVRVAVLRAISVNRHAGALPRLAQALRRKELRLADLTEKVALFEAYGRVCGEEGVATLNDMLHGRSLLSFREPPDVRACCARALGLVATPEAMRSLQRASDTKDRLVRTEVLRALRRPQ